MKKLDEHYMLLEDDDVIREGDEGSFSRINWWPFGTNKGFPEWIGRRAGDWGLTRKKPYIRRHVTPGEIALTQL